MSQLADKEAESAAENPPRQRAISARELYAAVTDPEADFSSAATVEALRAEIAAAGEADAQGLPSAQSEMAAWAAQERSRTASLAGKTTSGDLLVRRVALATAPLGLTSGAWLQWLSAPGNCHRELNLTVLALYASDVDVGRPRGSRGDAYLDLLRQLRLADHAAPPIRLAHERRVPDFAFTLPAMLLALSRRPDSFSSEILGADLCLRNVGLPPPLIALEGVDGAAPDWTALDPGQDRGHDWTGGLEQARAAVSCHLRHSPDAERPLLRGFAWARDSVQRSAELLREELSQLNPAFEMAALLRLRAREGSVYHQSFELMGRPLSYWLRESQADPFPLLGALASSPLVAPGRSAESRLVTDLVGERGPMFRIFAPDDLAVIRRWIDALPAAGTTKASGPPSRCGELPGRLLVAEPETGEAPSAVRDAYHLLQSRTDPSTLSRWARSYVRGWLARSRTGLAVNARQLPTSWPTEGLRPWLLDQHDRHAASFEQDMSVPIPPRDRLIDSTVQTSALTLIDGSWLHGFTDYQHASTEVGRFLFDTYWDELGNGRLDLNHPHIYRELLEEMGVDLPPTASKAFARSPLLRDRSFELPVYWLSIGRFPRSFMPEILGLNLAMELSGVGGSYRQAKIHLKHWGFSTRFVDVHNTIDNVATGHSAWAADAVDTLITATGEAQGQVAQEGTWERVRTGFVSLDPPAGRRARIAQGRAQRRALKAYRG